ncbi:23697_t:CDS:2, partial [Gigaspora margarita]
GALDKEVFHNESFFKETQKNQGAINEIDAFLKTNNIKVFDYSDFKNHQEVDKGGSAMIYSANFQRQKYALKSLDDNINKEWDNKKVKEFLNEYAIAIKTFNGGREEMIPGTPQGYADIYKNCWSPEPEKRPKLDDILSNLDKLSTNTF